MVVNMEQTRPKLRTLHLGTMKNPVKPDYGVYFKEWTLGCRNRRPTSRLQTVNAGFLEKNTNQCTEAVGNTV